MEVEQSGLDLPQVAIESSEVKSLESVDMELHAFDELLNSYLNIVSRPVRPSDPDQAESTPDYMRVPRLKFLLELKDPYLEESKLQKQIMELIEKNNMLPFYNKLCAKFKWPVNADLERQMQNFIDEETKKLDELDKDDENLPIAWKARLDFLLKTGDFKNAYELAFKRSEDASLSTNPRLEATFALFRIAYADGCDIHAMEKAVDKAKYFIDSNEHKADWTGRNKFKAYEGLYGLAVRDYKRAADNLSDCISTFESYELTDFATIVKFTVIACMIALPRSGIQKKVVNYGLIMQELNCEQRHHLKEYVLSFNECRYGDFLKILAVTEILLRFEPLTFPHYRQYVRDMKLKAYAQMLQSYSIVSLKRMAEIFGVTSDYIEEDIRKFTTAGKLMCRIDKVAGKIYTAHYADEAYDRSMAYQSSIKKGDLLLNRIKSLARVVET